MLKKANISQEYPEAFRKAISHIREKKDYDFSSTELLKPLQELYHCKMHDYEIDALKNTAALLGTGFHLLMEQQKLDNPDDWILEERYYKEVEGYIISGQMDAYYKPEKTLWDYKTTNMYKAEKALKSSDLTKDAREWVLQMNIYRYLSDLEFNRIKILAIVKDFKYNRSNYVKSPAIIVQLPIVKYESIEKWLRKRVREIKRMFDTGDYPACTLEERWNGNKCENFCEAMPFCDQYQWIEQGSLM